MNKYLEKYLIKRTIGKLKDECYDLYKDCLTMGNYGISTMGIIEKKIHKIHSNEDLLKYHIEKINKIKQSKYYVVSDEIKKNLTLIEKYIHAENIVWSELATIVNSAYETISSPIGLSIYSGKLNAIEWLVVGIIGISVIMLLIR